MRNQPIYTIVSVSLESITIRDCCDGGQLSVTNGAEQVVQRLRDQGLLPAGRRLFCYDTENQLDELVVRDGKFAGFAPGPR